ncbi:hypothetical protein JCM11641_004398 [Rhodosporidiobolus odoratus]
MLDRLPPELLTLILQLATPVEHSFDAQYQFRRSLLRNCCLVSKKLCAVAKPMLPEVFQAAEEKDLAVLVALDGDPRRRSQVELLIAEGARAHGQDGFVSSLLQVCDSEVCRRVVDLRVRRYSSVTPAPLEGFKNLQRLVLQIDQLTLSCPLCLPQFLELSIQLKVPPTAGTAARLLPISSLPSLRALAFAIHQKALPSLHKLDILAQLHVFPQHTLCARS